MHGDLDEEIDGLHRKIRQLKGVAQEIESEAKFQNDFLAQLFQKIKDAIARHNTARCSMGPPAGVGDLTILENPSLPEKPAEAGSRLVVLGNFTEFERGVLWLSHNLTFDVDARINLFECNIRVLGGLVFAHIIAADNKSRLNDGLYKNQLLNLAEDLGRRFLPAFETSTGLPYAWINLKGAHL